MKRIQCEVCGSISLLKKNDIYECQHCGVQYEIDSIKKMLVEIDHSSEVNNYLKRADKFKNEGDIYEAKEYYNKALDYDATNPYANDNLNRINLIEKWKYYNVCIQQIGVEQGLDMFIDNLINTGDVEKDIFNDITILSVSEKYILGIIYKFQLRYDWTAIACYNHDYEETYYVHGERMTRTKTYTTRNSIQGEEYRDGKLFYLAADFTKILPECQPDTAAFFRDNFENELKKIKLDYNPINTNTLFQNEGIVQYNKIPIDITYNSEQYDAKKEVQYNKISKLVDKNLPKSLRTDYRASYIDNFDYKLYVDYFDENKILIPIIYIQYLYKGQKYLAVVNAVQNNSILMTYPVDKEIDSLKTSFMSAHKSARNMWFFFITLFLLLTSIGIYIHHWINQIKPKFALGYTYSQIINNPSFLEIKNAEYLSLFAILLTSIAFIFTAVVKFKQVREKKAKESVLNKAIRIRTIYKKESSKTLLDSCINFKSGIEQDRFSENQSDSTESKNEFKIASKNQAPISLYSDLKI